MDGPHVYRLHWQRRAALTAVGALLGYGAFEWFFVYQPRGRGAALGIFLVIGSLYALCYAWAYKVILADDGITVVTPNLDWLGRRDGKEERSTRIKVYRTDIAGVVRLPSAQNPQVLAFIPKAEGGDAAYVLVRRLHPDDYFLQWCDSFRDLDPEDEHVKGYLKADAEYIPGEANPAIADADANRPTLGGVRVSGWVVLLALVLVIVVVGVGVTIASRFQ